jgi:hypothetical protein
MRATKKTGTTGKTELFTVRFEHDVVAKLDRLAADLSRPGLEATRTDALRVAVVIGLAAFEGDGPKRRG